MITAGRLLREACERGGFRGYMALVTLTYGGGAQVGWSPRHITAFLKCTRSWFARQGIPLRYVWAAELGEEHGRLHYHVLVWVPRGYMLPKPDKRGWWRHGWSRIERARHPGYLTKYATKGISQPHAFPKGARIHGAGGLSAADRRERRWWLAPAYVRRAWPDSTEADPVRVSGGGWANRATGEFLEAMYRLLGIGPGGVLRLGLVGAGLPARSGGRPANASTDGRIEA